MINETEIKKLTYYVTDILRGHFNVYDAFTTGISYAFISLLTKNEFESLSEFDLNNIINDREISIFIDEKLHKTNNKKVYELMRSYDDEFLLEYILYADTFFDMMTESTPKALIKLSKKILDIKEKENVADICSGTGSFIFDSIKNKTETNFYGKEINYNAYMLSKLKLYVYENYYNLNKNVVNIENGDVFISWKNLTNKFDKVFSNYPFGYKVIDFSVGQQFLDQIKNKYYSIKKTNSSDWIFNLLLLETLKENGKAVALMTNGSTWNSIDQPIRKELIEKGYIEAVISLPAKLFNYTAIETTLIVLSKNNNKIKFVDARTYCVQGRRENILTDENIDQIIYALKHETKKSKFANLEEVKENDFTLSPIRFLANDIEVENGVSFEKLIKNITRGASISAKDLDNLISDKSTDYQYLMLSNIKDGIIDEELPYLQSIEKKNEKYCIKNNNLLLSKNGYPFKVAVANINSDKKVLANGNLFVIEIDEDKIEPYYLQAFLESETGVALLKSITVGSTIPNINISGLNKIKIPMLPLEKQKEIANKYKANLDEYLYLKTRLENISTSLKNVYDNETKED